MNAATSGEPLVSVVIPVRDRGDSLVRCLRSVLSQSVEDIEVIVIENNSIDPRAVALSVAELNDDRVRVEHLAKCENANVARNHGVSLARGNFVAFMDSDDQWYPEHLSRAIAVLDESRSSFYYSSMDVNDGCRVQRRLARPLRPGEDPSDYLFGRNRAFAPTPSFVIRRSVCDVIWDEDLSRHQDFDYFIRICRVCRSTGSIESAGRINWQKKKPRHYDRASLILFYRKHSHAFLPNTRLRFCWDKVKLAVRRHDVRLFLEFLFQMLAVMCRSKRRGSA